MIYSIVQVVAIFFIPLLIIKYHDFKLTKLFGTIGTAYLSGIFVALVLFLLSKVGITITPNKDIGEIGSHLAISVGIPLLLFSANLKEARKLSKSVILSFLSVIVSVILVSSLTFYLYARNIENGAELSAMAIGLYTGGTPNLNALGNIFALSIEQIGVANFSDMIIGAVFYVFLLVLAKPVVTFLIGKKAHKGAYLRESIDYVNTEKLNIKEFKHTKGLWFSILLAFFMAVIGAGVGILIWVILGAVQGRMTDYIVPAMMITVTVLGIIASFSKKIRETKGTNIVGQYMILVFSFALASSIDLNQISSQFGQTILLYGIITVASFFVHILFSRFLRIDADCAIVTATAGIYGPAFVPAITNQLKNDDLTVP